MAYRIEHSDNADDVRKERKEDLETVKRIRESWENMKMEYSIDKEEDPVFDEETRKESLENSDYDDSDRLWEEPDDDEEEFSFDEETRKESMDNHEDEYGEVKMKVVEKKGRKLNVNGILVAMTCILVLVLVLENLYFFVFRKPEEFKVYDVRESYFKYDEEIVPELRNYRSIRKIKLNDDITLEISERALEKIK